MRARAKRNASPPDRPTPPSPSICRGCAWSTACRRASVRACCTAALSTVGRPSEILACTVPANTCCRWPIQPISPGLSVVLRLPALTGSKPAMVASRVDLPQPLVPVTARCSPDCRMSDRPLKTGCWLPACCTASSLRLSRALPGGAVLRSGNETPRSVRRTIASMAEVPAARSCQTADSSRSGSKKVGARSRMKSPSPRLKRAPHAPKFK